MLTFYEETISENKIEKYLAENELVHTIFFI